MECLPAGPAGGSPLCGEPHLADVVANDWLALTWQVDSDDIDAAGHTGPIVCLAEVGEHGPELVTLGVIDLGLRRAHAGQGNAGFDLHEHDGLAVWVAGDDVHLTHGQDDVGPEDGEAGGPEVIGSGAFTALAQGVVGPGASARACDASPHGRQGVKNGIANLNLPCDGTPPGATIYCRGGGGVVVPAGAGAAGAAGVPVGRPEPIFDV